MITRCQYKGCDGKINIAGWCTRCGKVEKE